MSPHSPLLPLLADPVDGSCLIIDEENNLISDNGVLYPIKSSVPILLPQVGGNFSTYTTHYQKDAESFDYTNISTNKVEEVELDRLHQFILSHCKTTNGFTLDVGCGGGWLAKYLLPRGAQLISMDISDVNPIQAIHKYPSPNHFGLVADVYHLPLKKESVGCIVASEIIEHVADPALFIEKLWTALKPGGKLIISTPHDEFIRSTLCIHCNCPTPVNAHLHSFTEEKIKALLPNEAHSISINLLNSKLLVQTRIQKILQFLPEYLWRKLDQATIHLTRKKCYRLVVCMQK